jgi:N-acetylneuraminate synthase/N,N'-diacetyllegionaminate synthase
LKVVQFTDKLFDEGSMHIADHDLNEKVFIVAEIGVNHEGSLETARMLIEKAVEAGADAVKFQTYLPEEYVTSADKERFARVGRFALSTDEFRQLADQARSLGVIFFSTPLGISSVDALDPFVPFFKISSGDLTYHPMLALAAQKGKPVVLSTGGATVEEIDAAVAVLKEHGPDRPLNEWLLLNQCVACYPAPAEQINLRSMAFLRERYGVLVGYSDHTLSNAMCLAAVALGARWIEKHFTDRKTGRDFHDHALSSEPEEMAQLVRDVRDIEAGLGQGGKFRAPCEETGLPRLRRGIAVRRDMKAGEMITAEDITWLRPQSDFPIGAEDQVIGQTLTQDLPAGYLIQPEHLGTGVNSN